MAGSRLWGIEGVRDQIVRWIPSADLGVLAATSSEQRRLTLLARKERRIRRVRDEGRIKIAALVEKQMLYDLWEHAPNQPPNQYPEADPLPADYGTIKEFLRRKLDLWENYDRDFPQRPAYGPTDAYVAAARAYIARIAAALDVGGEDERYSRPYRVCKFYYQNDDGEGDGERDSPCWRRMYPASEPVFHLHRGMEYVNMRRLTWFLPRDYPEYCCTGCLEDYQAAYANGDKVIECGAGDDVCDNIMETGAGVWAQAEDGFQGLWCGECAREWPEAVLRVQH